MAGNQITRHQMREYAFMLTFERIFHQGDIEDVIQYAEETEIIQLSLSVLDLFKGVDENIELLDSHISRHLKKWTIDRISTVSLAVLRVAMYEILFSKDIEIDIIISEAVKIAQTYTLKEDVSFVNGVLSSIAKEQSKEKNSTNSNSKEEPTLESETTESE